MGSSPAQRVDEELVDRDRILKDLHKQLQKSQRSMKENADKHRRDVVFKVGDMVYVRLQHRRQQSLAHRTDGYKLSPIYFGPYKVIRRIGQVAYRLQLPDDSYIYPVFHASHLRLCKGQIRPSDVRQLSWKTGYIPLYTPKELIGVRETSKGVEVLLRWTKLPDDEATWESLDYIHERFPEFGLKEKARIWLDGDQPAPVSVQIVTADLEDKVNLKGAGVDKTLQNFCASRGDTKASKPSEGYTGDSQARGQRVDLARMVLGPGQGLTCPHMTRPMSTRLSVLPNLGLFPRLGAPWILGQFPNCAQSSSIKKHAKIWGLGRDKGRRGFLNPQAKRVPLLGNQGLFGFPKTTQVLSTRLILSPFGFLSPKSSRSPRQDTREFPTSFKFLYSSHVYQQGAQAYQERIFQPTMGRISKTYKSLHVWAKPKATRIRKPKFPNPCYSSSINRRP